MLRKLRSFIPSERAAVLLVLLDAVGAAEALRVVLLRRMRRYLALVLEGFGTLKVTHEPLSSTLLSCLVLSVLLHAELSAIALARLGHRGKLLLTQNFVALEHLLAQLVQSDRLLVAGSLDSLRSPSAVLLGDVVLNVECKCQKERDQYKRKFVSKTFVF